MFNHMFFIGFFSGIFIISMVFAIYERANRAERVKLLKKFQDKYKEILDTQKVAALVKERLVKVQNLTEQQLDLMYQLEAPQRNGLDGRNKQRLNREIKQIDEEKTSLLRSIIADGHDPKMVILNEAGEREVLHLSEFMKRKNILDAQEDKPTVAPVIKPNLSIVKNKDK